MKDVFVISGEVITSLGFSLTENFDRIKTRETGIRSYQNHPYSPQPFFASMVSPELLNDHFSKVDVQGEYTRLEKLMILSIMGCLSDTRVNLADKDTLLVISTTKGNIDVLDGTSGGSFPASRSYLHELGNSLKKFFHAVNSPLIICNACISGVMGIMTASRFIRSGKYKNIVVCGGDLVSPFTVSGFQSFKAFGTMPCKPYDAARDGLSLGEGAGAVLLSAGTDQLSQHGIARVLGGAVSNDANHISGPSRTGDGLYAAIMKTLDESSVDAGRIDYISAHGTATPYNDEMEAKAMHTAGLDHKPLNSFKGAIGHTLGAAGVIESLLAIESMKKKTLLPSTGYETMGVTQPIHVIREAARADLKLTLKTASGFGGCNAAVVYSLING